MFPIIKNIGLIVAVAMALNLSSVALAGSGVGSENSGRIPLALVADLTYRNKTITEDTTWKGNILIEGGLVLASQATLTIEPGTTIFFGRSSAGEKPAFLIHGRIQALGGADKPIVFSSPFAEPSRGDWQGLVIMASEKKNILENCRIVGAETGIEVLFSRMTMKNVTFAACGTGARVQDSMAVMAGGGATGCATGMNLVETEADVRGGEFTGNDQGIVAVNSSLYLGGATVENNRRDGLKVDGGRIRVISNSFGVNGSGITLNQCEGTVSGNKVLKNKEYGVSLTKARVKLTANDISGNTKVGLRVEDGKGVAWGNTFSGNGEHDLYNGGSEDFKAMGNWWGSIAVEGRIHDKKNDPSLGTVFYLPMLNARPQSDL